MKRLLTVLVLLLVILAGCGDNDYELPPVVEAEATPAPAETAVPPTRADAAIRLAYMQEPDGFTQAVSLRTREGFPFGHVSTTDDTPFEFSLQDGGSFNVVSDPEEMARRLDLPPDNPDMINAVIISFLDFARVHEAGGRLKLVSLISMDAQGGFYGLFLREGLLRHEHLSIPLVDGFVAQVDEAQRESYLQVDNRILLPQDNTALVRAMQDAFSAIDSVFTRDIASSLFYPRLIPPNRDAELPFVIYISDDMQVFAGEFGVTISAQAISIDGGYITYQWFNANSGWPVTGVSAYGDFSVFGDTPPRLWPGMQYSDYNRFFVRITNTNYGATGEQVAEHTSEVVTIRVVREPEPPNFELHAYHAYILFEPQPTGSLAVLLDVYTETNKIRRIVRDWIFPDGDSSQVTSIIIEGHYDDVHGFGHPTGNALDLCVNRATLVYQIMRDMGVYIPIITRYNPDQNIQGIQTSATIRLIGRE